MEIIHKKPNFATLPGGVDLSINGQDERIKLTGCGYPQGSLRNIDLDYSVFHNVLSEDDCKQLINLFTTQITKQKVSVHGVLDSNENCGVGSIRTTGWSLRIAQMIWDLLSQYPITNTLYANEYYSTDWHQGNVSKYWKPVGLSPMLRFMNYEVGGQHFAHYDAGYIFDNPRFRTLKSVVIYLSSHTYDQGGATRFINDGQKNIPIIERNHDDWTRQALDHEVIYSIWPKMGNILTFPHRLCHDVQAYIGKEPRIIIRGDIIYEAQ
jgi:hypothetical protein